MSVRTKQSEDKQLQCFSANMERRNIGAGCQYGGVQVTKAGGHNGGSIAHTSVAGLIKAISSVTACAESKHR